MWEDEIMRKMSLAFLLITWGVGCTTTALISREKAVEIANAKAIECGWILENYEQPTVTEFKDQGRARWFLFYEGKEKTVGNHFSVSVDQQTGKAHLEPGA